MNFLHATTLSTTLFRFVSQNPYATGYYISLISLLQRNTPITMTYTKSYVALITELIWQVSIRDDRKVQELHKKRQRKSPRARGYTLSATGPLEIVTADMPGTLHRTTQVNKCVLIIIDTYSRIIHVIFTSKKTSAHIADLVFDRNMVPFDIPATYGRIMERSC